MRVIGFEPIITRWKRVRLPLTYTRLKLQPRGLSPGVCPLALRLYYPQQQTPPWGRFSTGGAAPSHRSTPPP
jgi:hypothetical protein